MSSEAKIVAASDAEIAALRELEAKATQGEWIGRRDASGEEGDGCIRFVHSDGGERDVFSSCYWDLNDIDLVVAMRNQLVPLLARLEQQERELGTAKELIAVMEERLERLEADEERYRDALRPFALAASSAIQRVHPYVIDQEDLESARAALAAAEKTAEGK